MIMIAASFDFQWPSDVTKLYSFAEPVSQASQQVISVDCFLSGQSSADANSTSSSSQTTGHSFLFFSRIIYFKEMIMALIPIIFFVVSYSVWAVISCKNKDYSVLKTRAIASVVILLFFVHPNLVQFMFDMFDCINVDGD